jgi:hypothetical protein
VEPEFLFLASDLDLDHRQLGSNPKLPLDISYPHTKFGNRQFGVNRQLSQKNLKENSELKRGITLAR